MDRERKLGQLAGIIAHHAASEGRVPTAIDGVDLFRASTPSPIRCTLYYACVIIVAQGKKQARVGEEIFEYSPARYLVLPVSLPIDARVFEASPDQPFLSFSIQVDPTALGEIVSEMAPGAPGPRAELRGIAVSETTEELLDASVRLLSCLGSESDCRVLAPQYKREILYRVLKGPQGELLQEVGYRDSRLGKIARALGFIHAHYERPLGVAELAAEARMSESMFYVAFRSITTKSPLQYLKEIRLNRARQIMLWEGTNAQQAAARVGYGSPSQFSREFKRRFGRPPSQERAWAMESGELTGARPY